MNVDPLKFLEDLSTSVAKTEIDGLAKELIGSDAGWIKRFQETLPLVRMNIIAHYLLFVRVFMVYTFILSLSHTTVFRCNNAEETAFHTVCPQQLLQSGSQSEEGVG